jgi:dTDP-4-amino-4,6-dideoxygalactose transaminase
MGLHDRNSTPAVLSRDLGTPPQIPPSAIARATALMNSGRVHRYGELPKGEDSDVAQLEIAFADLLGARFAVGVNSCGCALYLSLVASGLRPGDPVLMNAFTLAPVPGAVAHAGGKPVLVDITDDYVIDLEDLERKADTTGARHLLLSHMRGHIGDMEKLAAFCSRRGIALIEDCAHTLGARWNGRPTGRFGAAGCFSFQSYKHVNGGEGGIIVTDDEDIAARAILLSGSYMLYRQNGARPPDEAFDRWRDVTPNLSMRLSNLVAALVLPQLALLTERAAIWNSRHDHLAARLRQLNGLRLPTRPIPEQYVQSSIQFEAPDLEPAQMERFALACAARGVFLKWFGADEPRGFTSQSQHWRYIENVEAPPRARKILRHLFDMRLPLTLTPDECDTIADIVGECLADLPAA